MVDRQKTNRYREWIPLTCSSVLQQLIHQRQVWYSEVNWEGFVVSGLKVTHIAAGKSPANS